MTEDSDIILLHLLLQALQHTYTTRSPCTDICALFVPDPHPEDICCMFACTPRQRRQDATLQGEDMYAA